MTLIRWTGLRRISHIDGVFRTPGSTERVSADRARRYAERGFARIVSSSDETTPARATDTPDPEPPAEERMLLERGDMDADVDVCVPLYKSAGHFEKLLASLARSGATFNLCCVVDGDGYDPVGAVLGILPETVSARIVALSRNTGFAHASNTAARLGRAEHILFCNADVQVSPGFLEPLVETLRAHPDCAAAGGFQTRRGRIHSVGSEYDRESRSYDHVLRDRPADLDHPLRTEPGERDVLTGSCLLVRRACFEAAGGFDEGYRVGYFEDADLCLAFRARGRTVRYVPESRVEHACGHSGAGGHPWHEANRERFHRRWVETGLVDRFARRRGRRLHGGRIVACWIVLNEAEYIAPSVESVYEMADKIIIVEGGNPVARAAGLCAPDGGSLDDTVDILLSLPDPSHKIRVVRGFWEDKTRQRAVYANMLRPDDIMLLLDGDEVLFDDEPWRLLDLMHDHDAVNFPMLTFWNDMDTLAVGVWETFRPAKCVRWKEGTRYETHTKLVRADGTPVGQPGDAGTHMLEIPLAAHYAYVKPLWKLRRKIDYYRRITGRVPADYFDEVFLGFRRDPSVVDRRGSHPFGGGGVAPFTGRHPEPIRRRIDAGLYCGEGW